uniref:Uncharacterized protein n=1 Tax=Timema tahoe TaxID=61484 RepID=A0A7R9INS2_9NEOP|nr:unnamed protein product [Timema tahoe]
MVVPRVISEVRKSRPDVENPSRDRPRIAVLSARKAKQSLYFPRILRHLGLRGAQLTSFVLLCRRRQRESWSGKRNNNMKQKQNTFDTACVFATLSYNNNNKNNIIRVHPPNEGDSILPDFFLLEAATQCGSAVCCERLASDHLGTNQLFQPLNTVCTKQGRDDLDKTLPSVPWPGYELWSSRPHYSTVSSSS